MCWGASTMFSGDQLHPAGGRQFCRTRLGSALADLPGRDDLVFDADVVTSELFTNSLRAGAQLIRLSLSLHRDVLRILVDDAASGRPTLRQAGADEDTGRGMSIVIALSIAWSIEALIPGKQVWADLQVDPALTADLPSCSRPTRFQVDVAPDALSDRDVSR